MKRYIGISVITLILAVSLIACMDIHEGDEPTPNSIGTSQDQSRHSQTNSPFRIHSVDTVHFNLAFYPCFRVQYPLVDSIGRSLPIGPIRPGHMTVAVSVDSVRLTFQTFTMWHARGVKFRIAIDENQMLNTPWEVVTFNPTDQRFDVRFGRPTNASYVAIQMEVDIQRTSILGTSNYHTTMHAYNEAISGNEYLKIEMPFECCQNFTYGGIFPNY
jgi:hypothetical protein